MPSLVARGVRTWRKKKLLLYPRRIFLNTTWRWAGYEYLGDPLGASRSIPRRPARLRMSAMRLRTARPPAKFRAFVRRLCIPPYAFGRGEIGAPVGGITTALWGNGPKCGEFAISLRIYSRSVTCRCGRRRAAVFQTRGR